eukprot:6712032-Alexandrium_andersonii.AAC.1
MRGGPGARGAAAPSTRSATTSARTAPTSRPGREGGTLPPRVQAESMPERTHRDPGIVDHRRTLAMGL